MKDTDRAMLRVLAALLRAKTMPDGAAEEFASFLDRIAGEGVERDRTEIRCVRCHAASQPGEVYIAILSGGFACTSCMRGRDAQGNCWRIPVGGVAPPEFRTELAPGPVHSDPHDWITDPLTGEQQ